MAPNSLASGSGRSEAGGWGWGGRGGGGSAPQSRRGRSQSAAVCSLFLRVIGGFRASENTPEPSLKSKQVIFIQKI